MNGEGSNEGQGRLKTKHISSACAICRKKKIKCDGATPRCSNCILYKQECIYQPTADKRKIQRKDRTAALEARIELLENLLREHGIAVPESNVELLSGLTPVTSLNEIGPETGANLVDDGDGDDSKPKEDSLVDQLSGRMGSLQIADDGQLRFYGPTSNLTILQNGPLSINATALHFSDDHWQQILNQAGVGQHVATELEDHLLKLYFCWEDPSIHVVDERIFWRERTDHAQALISSSTYSRLLTNAMCAVGASFSDRRYPDLPTPLTEFFAKRAKALLDVEMDSPGLSTVQSLVILSAVEAFSVRDARGWLYSGMAVRLATDLGLHVDAQNFVREGIITQEEADMRSMIFWGTFVHDRMWSMYVGRPCALESKHITLAHPQGAVDGAVTKDWYPYIDEYSSSAVPHMSDPLEDIARFNVLLCAKMQSIREVVYNNRKTTGSDVRRIHNFVNEMSKELRDWHIQLPASLTVDYGNTTSIYNPHVLQLHMQYHCIMILVNRPFLNASKYASDAQSTPTLSPRCACLEAANSIANLLRIFDRVYTLRRINVQAIHLIFTASMIHAFVACGAGNSTEVAAAAEALEVCCHALRTVGAQCKSAIRAYEVVIYLKGKLSERRRTTGKRPQPAGDGIPDIAKRIRLPSSMDNFDPSLTSTQAQMNEWDYLNMENTSPMAPYYENDAQLDSLFWADFTAIDSTNNLGWNYNG